MTSSGMGIFAKANSIPFSVILGISDRRHQIRCPFSENHSDGDRKRSARYYPDTNRVYCHMEGEGWSPVDYVAKREGITPLEAAKKLVRDYGQNAEGMEQALKTQIERELEASLPEKVVDLLYAGLEGASEDPVTRQYIAKQHELEVTEGVSLLESTEQEAEDLDAMKGDDSDVEDWEE